ncbi:MAG TPA: DUF5335 family protein [Myxococcaceae bacterium]|nr:DUF5335 family protein [Myxococcaceae bacterium]
MGIHSIEVPKQGWGSFLVALNRLAQDRPVRLEVISRELGDQEMADKLPLIGIDFETKGSERGDLLVTVLSDDGPLTHRIEKPTQFFLAHNETGELLQTVAVLDASGGETIIYFEDLPALPEQTGADASA